MTVWVRVDGLEVAVAEDYSIFMDVNNQGRMTLNLINVKTPEPVFPSPMRTSTDPNVLSPESEKYTNVIAALVHMLGGMVTIDSHELVADRTVTVYREQDPFRLMLRTE